MHNKRVVLLLGAVLCAILLMAAAAAPLPPKIFVNHQTQECAILIKGDECTDCFPPPGWEELGLYGEVSCPEGYKEIDLQLKCHPFKIARCCTEGHSGALGDCDDLVINRPKRQCAFVEDINIFQLSGNWQSRPEDVAPYDWTCPENFTWQNELLTPQETQTGLPARNITLIILGLMCVCGSSLLVGLLIVFLVLRQRKKNSV